MLVAAYRGEVRAPRLPSSRSARFEAALQGLALVVAPVIALPLADQDRGPRFLALAIIPAIWVAARAALLLAAVGLLLLTVSLSTVASVSLGRAPCRDSVLE